MKPKCFFRGCDHKMKTSIAKKKLMETIGWKPASQIGTW